MRTKNSFINFLANEGSIIVNIILSFITRTVFIYTLGKAYLGVNGLFANVLSVLSLAELGIGTAMIYHMYAPVANNDFVLQRKLMNLYRRLYKIVAAVVAVLGLILVPFLPYLIKEKDAAGIENLTLIYILYLFNTVASYFFSYKRSIINAHQKMYVVTIIDTICTSIQFIVQIVILLVFKNFILYLCIQIAAAILSNVFVSIRADKMYPFLKENKKDLPDEPLKKDIYKNIGAMSLHRFGDIFVNNTDNLIMSAFVGIIIEGVYSNYLLIQTSVYTALNSVFLAVTASVGDLSVKEDKEKLYDVYKMLYFLCFWLFSFSSVCFITLYNPFISFWTQKPDYTFEMPIVLLIVINFYFAGMRRVTLTFRDVLGLYWYDRYKPIFEAVINLVASLILVQKIGISGIFLGTLISTLTTCFWIEPLVTYKYGFKRNVGEYFGRFALYTAFTVAVGGLTYFLATRFEPGGLLEVAIKLLICIIVYNTILIAVFCRTNELQGLWKQAAKILRREHNA
ncbi:MAG: lipopolysaccharide biosynthesis protein [Lachnospiraceae bacterium]|nr:lipopolysaccharide biosynthesis protein [Lachnospiraceae bacterium]